MGNRSNIISYNANGYEIDPPISSLDQWLILQTWLNFNPSMDK